MNRYLLVFALVLFSTSTLGQSPETDGGPPPDAGVDAGVDPINCQALCITAYLPICIAECGGEPYCTDVCSDTYRQPCINSCEGGDIAPNDGGVLELVETPPPPPGHTVLNVVEDCDLTNEPTVLEQLADTFGFANPYDDVGAFYECQEKLVAAGGGDLYFPDGVYDFNSAPTYQALRLESHVHLRGQSTNGTVLRDNNPNLAAQLVGTSHWPYRDVVDVGVENLTVRGSRTVCGAGDNFHNHGVFFKNVTRAYVRNVRIENVGGDGLYINGGVHDFDVDGLKVVDFCRNAITINGGHPIPTTSDIRVTNIEAVKAADSPYGYDLDVETGVYGLNIHDVDVWVLHLGGARDSRVSNSTVRRHIIGGWGDNVTVSGVTFKYGGGTNLQMDHSGRFTVDGCSFECGDEEVGGPADGTCIYANNTYGNSTGSVVRDSFFKCVTPGVGCYAPLKFLNGGILRVHGNTVLGVNDGRGGDQYVAAVPVPHPNLHFKYGFVHDQSASGPPLDPLIGHAYTVHDNYVNVSDWCVSVGSPSGVRGLVDVKDNIFKGCSVGVKTNYPPHEYPIHIGPNIGTSP